MMRFLSVLVLISTALLSACGGKNETIRNDIISQVQDHLAVGVSEYKKGDYSSSRQFLNQALDEAYSIDNMPGQISVLLSIGELNLLEGDYVEASNNIFFAWELAKTEEVTSKYFNLYSTTGKYYSKISNYTLAIEYYNNAIKKTLNGAQRAIIFNNIGNIYRRQGDYESALDYLNDAYRINRRKKIYDQMANNSYNIGEIYYEQGEYEEAMEYYVTALEYDKVSENSVGIIGDLKKMGMTSYMMGNSLIAIHYLERAYRVADSVDLSSEKTKIQALITEYQAAID